MLLITSTWIRQNMASAMWGCLILMVWFDVKWDNFTWHCCPIAGSSGLWCDQSGWVPCTHGGYIKAKASLQFGRNIHLVCAKTAYEIWCFIPFKKVLGWNPLMCTAAAQRVTPGLGYGSGGGGGGDEIWVKWFIPNCRGRPQSPIKHWTCRSGVENLTLFLPCHVFYPFSI
jgi:hypothetical protein